MNTITRLFKSVIKDSFFLFGPRGTGKSTMMSSMFADAIWIDFLHPEVERNYRAKPEILYDYLLAKKQAKIVVIDEVQKVPAVLSIVHDILERKQGWQFVLTGSSSRKIKRSGADLLGGRALNYTMHPFIAAELQGKFDLNQALLNGLLPLVFAAEDKVKTIQAYISLYLKEEIQMEGLVRNVDDFARFLEIVSFSHGQLLNVTNIARESGVKRKTVENYINILEDLLLSYKLPVFMKRAKRELVSSSKFYIFDAGIYNHLRPKGTLDRAEEISGAALEGLVMQHLKAWNDYGMDKNQLAFWRTRSGVEVDFVVYGENNFLAIEVKNSKNVYSKDVKPLKTFLQDYPMAQAVLLYRGKDRFMRNGVLCMPVEEFLLGLIPGKKSM